MLNIQTLVIGDLPTNCYLVSEGSSCIIIDPGDEADFITQTILEEKLKPISIVLTHGHFDHVLGCLELKLNFNIPILLHQSDLKIYTSANQSAFHWLKKKTLKVPPVDQFIKEGDEIKVGEEKLKVIETPGHTPGSVCLYQPPPPLKLRGGSEGVIFTGDTLFKDGVGRTDFSYSNPLQLTKSLAKLKKLPANTVIYPGHGDSSFLYDCLNLSKTTR